MADDWHCKQIVNGNEPIVVCERETLQAEIDRLRGLISEWAAAVGSPHRISYNDKEIDRVIVAEEALRREARRG